ncbi:hypothetical protein D9757_007355 [Collybiopsis confluens]|uniref:Uncharacterized protein n=1 Tax=Collybiopsis confluens TaxID=2823264 RepID=A0A8H5M7C4_9AGAR|nr:hypothetical protein D9757_007355 [Collybiopsis confluens]
MGKISEKNSGKNVPAGRGQRYQPYAPTQIRRKHLDATGSADIVKLTTGPDGSPAPTTPTKASRTPKRRSAEIIVLTDSGSEDATGSALSSSPFTLTPAKTPSRKRRPVDSEIIELTDSDSGVLPPSLSPLHPKRPGWGNKVSLKSLTGDAVPEPSTSAQPWTPLTPEPTPQKQPSAKNGASPSRSKRERSKVWIEWCKNRRWDPKNGPHYKRKPGTKEIHRTNTIKYFCLKEEEIDTAPYIEFVTGHYTSQLGRSYSLDDIHTLVSRKCAYLAGLDEMIDPETNEKEFLKRGWEMFTVENEKRAEAYKAKTGKTRKHPRRGTVRAQNSSPG